MLHSFNVLNILYRSAAVTLRQVIYLSAFLAHFMWYILGSHHEVSIIEILPYVAPVSMLHAFTGITPGYYLGVLSQRMYVMINYRHH